MSRQALDPLIDAIAERVIERLRERAVDERAIAEVLERAGYEIANDSSEDAK